MLLKAQSLVDRGAPLLAAEEMKAYSSEATRPALLLEAQIALAEPAAEDRDGVGLKTRAADLQTWVALHPEDALAWDALGQLWGRLGAPLRSLRAEAESRYALGDLLGAVDRLRAGQKIARGGGAVDFIDASVIDSRLRAIEGQRKADRGGSAGVAVKQTSPCDDQQPTNELGKRPRLHRDQLGRRDVALAMQQPIVEQLRLFHLQKVGA